MSSATDPSLLATLPARALLGRLLTVRVSLIAGWAVGIAWLHWAIGIPMPLLPMGAVLALMALFSLSTAWRLRLDVPATQMEFLAHLLADLTAFAVLVFFSGGVTNPFVSLMLVPVVIAAISLRAAIEPISALNPTGKGQAFTVLLTDGTGKTAAVHTRPDEPALQFPVGEIETDQVFEGGLFSGRVPLTTIRLPMQDFKGVDMSNIREMALVFDQTPGGSLFMGDLEVLR